MHRLPQPRDQPVTSPLLVGPAPLTRRPHGQIVEEGNVAHPGPPLHVPAYCTCMYPWSLFPSLTLQPMNARFESILPDSSSPEPTGQQTSGLGLAIAHRSA